MAEGYEHATWGMAGCMLGHLWAWEKIARDADERALIFEDDVQFTCSRGGFYRAIRESLNHLPWDLFYLGGSCQKHQAEISDTICRAAVVWYSCLYDFQVGS